MRNIYLPIAFALLFLVFGCKKEKATESNTFVVEYTNQPVMSNGNDTYHLDINNDGESDLYLFRSFDSGNQVTTFAVKLRGEYYNYNSHGTCVISTCKGYNGNYPITFKIGDIIDASTEFNSNDQLCLTLSDGSKKYPTECFFYNSPKYFAIRIVVDGKTYYGWLLFDHCALQKTVLCKTPNTAIKIGEE